MSGDVEPPVEEQQERQCVFSRYLAPGRFCCGCSLEYGVLLIGVFFLLSGFVGAIVVIHYFSFFDYYSPEQPDTKVLEKRKIKDGVIIAFAVTGIYIFGVITDIILIVGVLKIMAAFLGFWGVAIFLRGVGELILAILMPIRCFAGGLFCQGMEILSVWWAVQIALNFYSSYLAFSLAYYIVRERREEERGLPPTARRPDHPGHQHPRPPRDRSPPYQRR